MHNRLLQSSSIMQQLQDAMVPDGPPKDALHADVAAAAATAAAEQLAKRFDDRLGGFGGAPKFPRPSEINALLAAYLQAVKVGRVVLMACIGTNTMTLSDSVGSLHTPWCHSVL